MDCFRNSGFAEYELRENVQQFEDESWNLVMMKLSKEEFLEKLLQQAVSRRVHK